MKNLALALMLVTASMTIAHADSLLKPQGKAESLLPVDQAFQFNGAIQKGKTVSLDWTIAPGYYLYGHMFKLSVDAPASAKASFKLPPGEAKHDADFGDVQVYRGTLTVPLASGTPAPHTLRVRYQGCADAGVCYPPQTRIVALK